MAEIKIDPQGDDLNAWQIGSSGPPGVCLCCGQKFDDPKAKGLRDVHGKFRKPRTIMGPYLESPYIWVCSSCHALPYLYFPDKMLEPIYRDSKAKPAPPGQSFLD